MTAISDVSICNVGLTLLSSARITTLTEDSENARKCNAVYQILRDEMIEGHDWNFAKLQATLGLVASTPSTNWDYIYQLPTDCIRVYRMANDGDFQVYGDKLYTNETTAVIEYFARITDPMQFSPGFASALSARIARDLAYGITQSSTVADAMAKNYEARYSEAKASDAQSGTPQPPKRSSFIASRGYN